MNIPLPHRGQVTVTTAGAGPREPDDAALPLTADAVSGALKLLPELRLLAGLCTAALVVAALYFGRDIIMPLALALLLGFVLDPLVGHLKRWGLPRPAAVVVVVTLCLAMLVFAAVLIGKQISAISAELPTYETTIRHKLRELRDGASSPKMFEGVVRTIDTVKAEVDKAAPADAGGSPKARPAAPPQKVQVEQAPITPMHKLLRWLEVGSGPLATAGIVLVFVVLVLFDRVDLRDRMLRLWSGNLHRSIDALDEAGARIGKYLSMQLLVNLSYGVPMAAGLWLIGVPGAILWGMAAAALRYVPYVGPLISSVCPLVLAFAVDPGWSMLMWTVALIIGLELFSNNVVEPWLYGASTGLSAMSLIVAATFWTALWGPVGLVMSTPLTVCLLVVGRHLPRLQFLDVLLGSKPPLDEPTRLYHRLLTGDVEGAGDLAVENAEQLGATCFYEDIGVEVLRMASNDHLSVATAEHRHRVVAGIDGVTDTLRDRYPPAPSPSRVDILCLGGRWEVDILAAKMVAHAVSLSGSSARHSNVAQVITDDMASIDIQTAQAVCVSYFSPDPQIHAHHLCRRLRARWPEVRIVLALWNAAPDLLSPEAQEAMGADAVVTSINEALLKLAQLIGIDPRQGFLQAPVPDNDAQRLEALNDSGAQDARAQPIFDAAARRAADVFDMPMAMVTLINAERQTVHGAYGALSKLEGGAAASVNSPQLPRSLSMCGHVVAGGQALVVPDIARDIRFAGNPVLQGKGLRFYAGAPMRDANGHVLGTLCLLDAEPRTLTDRDVRLLQMLADDAMTALRSAAQQWALDASNATARETDPPDSAAGDLRPAY